MKSLLMSLCGFADIDVPVTGDFMTDGSFNNEVNEPEVILVNPCTGFTVLNAGQGNMIDVGGNLFGTGCDDFADNNISSSFIDDSTLFDSLSNDTSIDCFSSDSFSGDSFDDFSSSSGMDDF